MRFFASFDRFDIFGGLVGQNRFEGLEFEVIAGAKKFIESHEYPLMLFEAWVMDDLMKRGIGYLI